MASRPCITIIGTGLIGTSIGMAIQKARGQEILVLGHDRDPAQARFAACSTGVRRAPTCTGSPRISRLSANGSVATGFHLGANKSAIIEALTRAGLLMEGIFLRPIARPEASQG